MVKSRSLYLLVCLVLVFTLAGVFGATAISAQDATTTTTPTATPTTTPTTTPTGTASPTATPIVPELKLKCDVPSYSDNSGATFSYNVELTYSGNDTQTVTLSPAVNSQGWTSYITYSSKEVTSLPIGPLSYGSPDSKTLVVTFSPNTGNSPDPGTYSMTLKATAANGMTASIDLAATVKAKYSFSMSSTTGNLNTTAVAGKENHFSLNLSNTGSASLDNITLTSSMPSDWVITFNPSKVDSISAGQTQQVDVVIKPPEGKTVAGDYMITLRSSNSQVSSSTDIRVTVETSSIWGVVSIAIIVVVIAGLAGLFLKLGRR